MKSFDNNARLSQKFPLGALTAGDKKDLVITSRLANSPNKVAIYGWHQTNGVAIQPLYLGHGASWADYSHGIRLVQKKMMVNGVSKTVAEVLADPELAGLLSDEGIVISTKIYFLRLSQSCGAPKRHHHGQHQQNCSRTISKKLVQRANDVAATGSRRSHSHQCAERRIVHCRRKRRNSFFTVCRMEIPSNTLSAK